MGRVTIDIPLLLLATAAGERRLPLDDLTWLFVAAGAFAAVIALGGALFLLVWRKAMSRVTLKAGPVSLDMAAIDRVLEVTEATHEQVTAINRQVNHVPPDAPTLQDRITTIEQQIVTFAEAQLAIQEQQRWAAGALCAVAAQIGVDLPEHPPAT